MSAFERYERGLVLKQVKIYHSALEDFRQAAKDPQFAGKAYAQMALCYRSTGRYEEAVSAFRRALQSDTFSSQERVHILYLLGQTLESMGRYAETLEAYGWLRKEDADFKDVRQRIKRLTSGQGAASLSPRRTSQEGSGMRGWWGEFRRDIPDLMDRTLRSLGRYANDVASSAWIKRAGDLARDISHRAGQAQPKTDSCSPLPPPSRTSAGRRAGADKRHTARVPVHLRSQLAFKNRPLAGEGRLRDLSLGGCRVTSRVPVSVGAELECCIFPKDGVNPFIVETATVRWIRQQEFGLAFTKVHPVAHRQIAQLCSRPATA
jgi:tetratricopeptide (TPR) repeat protein